MLCGPLPSKRKKLFVCNITHKPAVIHILKTLPEHDFHDMKILIIYDLKLYFFVEKFAILYLGLIDA